MQMQNEAKPAMDGEASKQRELETETEKERERKREREKEDHKDMEEAKPWMEANREN